MYDSEIDVAIHAVTAAASVCRRVQAALVNDETVAKKDRSPVTVADFASQAVICQAIADAFPADPIVAEEDAQWLRSEDAAEVRAKVSVHATRHRANWSADAVLDAIDRGRHEGGSRGRFWALDPIDGTKGFIRRDQFAIALALIEDGRPVLGILGCPSLPMRGLGSTATGSLLVAAAGAGCRAAAIGQSDWEDLSVCAATAAAESAMCEPYEKEHTKQSLSSRIAERLGMRNTPVRLDSQAKYAVVARGEAGAYLRLPTRPGYEEKIWDHAAGYMVITEAGGRVSDVEGRPLDFSLGRTLRANRGVVATAAQLHDEVLAAVQAEMA
jgi:3'(2'), 5'-bisphosphate nucleotidase